MRLGNARQQPHDLRKITAKQLAGFGEELDLIVRADSQAAKPIPLRFELPAGAVRQGVYQQGFQFFDVGYASALAMIMFVVVMVLTVVQLALRRRDT